METGNGRDDSAVDKVIQYIKESIISHKFWVGSKLPTEQALCEMTGVSRSGVREAMKVLAASNIVTIRRGDGTYVSDPDDISYSSPMMFKILLRDTTLAELSSFREVMEMSVITLAIQNCTEENITKLKAINDEFFLMIDGDDSDYLKQAQQDIKFHRTLADITGNSVMRDVYLFIFEIFEPFIVRNFKNKKGGLATHNTHSNIIRAIEDKDFLLMGYAIKDSVDLWADWLVDNPNARSIVAGQLLRNGDSRKNEE